MAVQDYKINYKSDFVLNINGDAGWAVPFCIKFWTGMPSQAYFVGFDGVKYVNCRVGDTPTQLLVMFDDHHLPIGPLRMQIAYHTTIEEFPGSVFDEVTNARDVIVTIDGTDYQVMLDFTGEDAPELEFDLPAYANEAERIQNELQRQQNEADRIAAELQREQATAAAVQGAENVNAQLNGTTLTVTNRNGVSTSVNTKGEQGEQGPVGPEGPQGEQGVSIVSFLPKSETSTTLIYTITYSNGYTQDVAIPKGPKGDTGATGPTGPQGPQGVSVIGFTQTGETATNTMYNLVFSDGRTQSVAIPKGVKGDKGDTGNTGSQGAQGPKGDTVTATDYTLYGVQGSDSQGAMSQDATTKAISAQTGYYTCGTISGTAEKVVTVESGNVYKRTLGGHFKVKMTNKNTAASGVTLQIGSETAAALWYNGAAVSATNTWDAGEVISVYYDGTYYQASNAQGGSNKKIDAYLYGDLRTLALGQNYDLGESLRTEDKQFLRMTKAVGTMNTTDVVAVGDLKVYGANTYKALKAVSLYNGTDTEGLYAIGRPSIVTITVDATSLSIEEDTDVTITIGGNTQTITVPAAASETKAADIAALIAAAFTSIDGWTLTDNENGTLTLKCNTGGANTIVVSSEVGETGLVVTSTAVNGANTLSWYNEGVWGNVAIANYAADAAEIGVSDNTKMWQKLSVQDIIKSYTTQNSITKDISVKTVVLDNKKGNFAWNVGNVSSTTGQIVTFYKNRYTIFNKNSLGDNIHSFNIYTEGITGKHISLYYYNGSKYISVKELTAGDNIINLPNYQQFLILVWDKPTASQTANCVLQVIVDKKVKDVIQEHDNRITQVENALANTFTNPIIRTDYPDPAIWWGEDGYWYAFSTGSLSSREMYRSTNLINWENTGEIPFTQAAVEAWTALGKDGFWAPEVVKVGDKWNMYLSAAQNPMYVFTSNHPTFGFELVGVIANHVLTTENIDACVRYDRDGTLWLFFDSFRQGMYRVKLNETGTQIISDTLEHVAGLPSDAEGNTNRAKTFEGAYLYRRKGYWYLIVSAGVYLNATYCLKVGRSTTLDGTFVDKEGNPMTEGNASLLLSSSGTFFGTGHNGPIITDKDNRTWMFFHSHWTGFESAARPMCISEVLWDENGWPYFVNDTLTVSGVGPRM